MDPLHEAAHLLAVATVNPEAQGTKGWQLAVETREEELLRRHEAGEVAEAPEMVGVVVGELVWG